MNNNEMPRRKGFSFLSFFLGILLGIILVIGTVVGVVLYVLNGKIEDVMGTVGVENKDEDGNYIYINTDKENGGAETLLDLISKISSFAGNTDTLSVGQVEGLLPVVGGFVDQLCDELNKYVVIDREELVSTPFGQIGEWVQEQVLSIQPASLLGVVGMDGALDNKIVSLLLEGHEADYVVSGSAKYPAYYDTYTLSGNTYVRGDGQPLPAGLESALVSKNDEYRLYFYENNGQNYVTDGSFGVSGNTYAPSENAKLSGNYYFNGGEKVTVSPITLRDFSDGEFAMLNDVYLTDFFEEGTSDLADKVLAGISLGDVVNGRLDLNEALANLTLADLIENISATDAVMVSLAYKVSRVSKVQNQSYSHTGLLKTENGKIDVFIETDNNNVKRVYYISDDGKEVDVPAMSVSELMEGINVDDLISDFTVADFVAIRPEDKIMAYIAYGIYGIDTDTNTAFVEIDGVETKCTIFVDEDGAISSVMTSGGVKVYGAPIGEITDSMNSITDKLTISDIVDVSGNSLLEKLGDKTINELSGAIDELTLGDVVEVGDNKILNKLKDTPIGELSDALNELTLGDVVETDGNKLLTKLAEKKINELSSAIDELTIGDVVDVGESKILKALEKEQIKNLSTAVENLKIGDVIDTDGSPMLEALSIYTIKELPDAVNKLTIGQVVGDTSGNPLLGRLKDTAIEDLSSEINELTVGDVMTVDEGTFLLSEFKDTKITELPKEVGRVSINTIYAKDIYCIKNDDGEVVVPAELKLATEYDVRYLYYVKRDDDKFELVGKSGRLTKSDFESNPGKYYTYGEAHGVWQTLLYDNGVERAYSLEELDQLMTNVSNNISKSDLNNLVDLGILDLDKDKLDKKLYYFDGNGFVEHNKTIGEMPLIDLINFVLDNVARS